MQGKMIGDATWSVFIMPTIMSHILTLGSVIYQTSHIELCAFDAMHQELVSTVALSFPFLIIFRIKCKWTSH